jgi:hypothetical protein
MNEEFVINSENLLPKEENKEKESLIKKEDKIDNLLEVLKDNNEEKEKDEKMNGWLQFLLIIIVIFLYFFFGAVFFHRIEGHDFFSSFIYAFVLNIQTQAVNAVFDDITLPVRTDLGKIFQIFFTFTGKLNKLKIILKDL